MTDKTIYPYIHYPRTTDLDLQMAELIYPILVERAPSGKPITYKGVVESVKERHPDIPVTISGDQWGDQWGQTRSVHQSVSHRSAINHNLRIIPMKTEIQQYIDFIFLDSGSPLCYARNDGVF